MHTRIIEMSKMTPKSFYHDTIVNEIESSSLENAAEILPAPKSAVEIHLRIDDNATDSSLLLCFTCFVYKFVGVVAVVDLVHRTLLTSNLQNVSS